MTPEASGADTGYSAILGGSFDPIHLGHLHIAEQILQYPEIDRVIFMPVQRHRFKSASIIADFDTRLRLIRACLRDGMEAWDADGSGSGYTADLMRKLYRLRPDLSFLFVIGADNLPALTAWYDFDWLCANVQFLVIPRPDYPPDPMMLSLIDAQVLEIPLSPVSSTEVRRRANSGEALDGYVPDRIKEEVRKIYGPQR